MIRLTGEMEGDVEIRRRRKVRRSSKKRKEEN